MAKSTANSACSVRKPNLTDLNDIGFIQEPTASDPLCGHSRHDALAAGCYYDLMASRWYSPECYNAEVLETFLEEVHLSWFHDEEHTEPATMDLVRSGNFDRLYPLHNYHIMHCLYQWRRLHLAFIEHRHIDEDVFSYTHTLHCTQMLLNWPEELKYGKNTTTISNSGPVKCIPGKLGFMSSD